MLSAIIKWAIARRWLLFSVVLSSPFGYLHHHPDMDVSFPSFAPQVEIQTESPGLAPERSESLATLPIESAIGTQE